MDKYIESGFWTSAYTRAFMDAVQSAQIGRASQQISLNPMTDAELIDEQWEEFDAIAEDTANAVLAARHRAIAKKKR